MGSINVGAELANQVDDANRSNDHARHDVAEFVLSSGLVRRSVAIKDETAVAVVERLGRAEDLPAMELASVLAAARTYEQIDYGLSN